MTNKYISMVALAVAIVAIAIVWNPAPKLSGSTDDFFDAKGGFKVSGTTVIDSSGNIDAPVTSSTGTFSSTLSVTGATTLSSGIILDTGSITATTTLTSASDNYQLLPASANAITITLPAATDGLRYEFVVTGALTGGFVTIDSAEGDNINGILMVNDTDVACEGEDQLDIVTDGEVIGDRVELISDGTSWYILDSDVDAAGKMTCTDPT
jgi:hypothetical protein